MFARIIDDFKDSSGIVMRQTFLVAAAALALFITTSFLCAAAFVAVLQRYGLIEACLTGAAVFFIVTLIAAISYMLRKRKLKVRVREATKETKSAMQSAEAPVFPFTALFWPWAQLEVPVSRGKLHCLCSSGCPRCD